MNHLKEILLGIGSAMNAFGTHPNYQRPERGEIGRDLAAISGDMRVVGEDLRRTSEKTAKGSNGQQAHYRTGARKG